ncbi:MULTISPECIES: hypothetical protein [unclassified Streptomyces]|uniref:hypothetical protein n=1 Tax=unclassified Streptomyces TaxID=2593676 RepID=UPI00225BB3BB|nr:MULTISPECIES: hypothetical protein [unclassified Streptomyces]MCX5336135.1 hypothetical protein [Streptomyces sp. NBC_00140]MCX5366856.1 hypothetical protein [Streptomyces sp. NBC_00124]
MSTLEFTVLGLDLSTPRPTHEHGRLAAKILKPGTKLTTVFVSHGPGRRGEMNMGLVWAC